MPAEVIETTRTPPLWSVKARGRYKATFTGPDARAKAEAYAVENLGEFAVKAKPIPGKESRRLAARG